MYHIILAGDSIFDNKRYVRSGEPDVATQVKDLLDRSDDVSLLAFDGDVTKNVEDQLKGLPNDATHLFISVGGNDAIGNLRLLERSVSNIGDAFNEFYDVMKDFEKDYIKMLVNAMRCGLKTTICTIYHPNFDLGRSDRIEHLLPHRVELPQIQKKAITGLTIFNDIIFQEAVNFGLPVMDLRLIFTEDSDYANAIEPSAVGGAKMARVIKEIVHDHDFSSSNTVVFK